MNEKDAKVIKALADLGLHPEATLSPEEEDMLRKAMDPHEQFLDDVEALFKQEQ